ncbi:unnamed protein product, partial [Mesorhabditis belari]|uniref:Uncharacterized protein n=1 Tax=Mesorhabditis belari TaxID=2138241 RepID=A0AAF3EEF3_9BILA
MIVSIFTLVCFCLATPAVLAAPANGIPITPSSLPVVTDPDVPDVTDATDTPSPSPSIPIHPCPMFMCAMNSGMRISTDNRPPPCGCPPLPMGPGPVIVGTTTTQSP